MLELAAKRAWGAHQLGMPAEHTAQSRAVLGPDALPAGKVVIAIVGASDVSAQVE